VYLSCALNFDRDSETGELFSVEPSPLRNQTTSKAEARKFPAVAFALDPETKSDWLAFFKRDFQLEKFFELYCGDEFLGNFSTAPMGKKGQDVQEVWSFRRTSLDGFKAAAFASDARAGVVLVFREVPPDAEPFGIWFGWLILSDANDVVVVDIQNSRAEEGLGDAVSALAWVESPRQEVFFAPIKLRASV
jgi:hypothetical protein